MSAAAPIEESAPLKRMRTESEQPDFNALAQALRTRAVHPPLPVSQPETLPNLMAPPPPDQGAMPTPSLPTPFSAAPPLQTCAAHPAPAPAVALVEKPVLAPEANGEEQTAKSLSTAPQPSPQQVLPPMPQPQWQIVAPPLLSSPSLQHSPPPPVAPPLPQALPPPQQVQQQLQHMQQQVQQQPQPTHQSMVARAPPPPDGRPPPLTEAERAAMIKSVQKATAAANKTLGASAPPAPPLLAACRHPSVPPYISLPNAELVHDPSAVDPSPAGSNRMFAVDVPWHDAMKVGAKVSGHCLVMGGRLGFSVPDCGAKPFRLQLPLPAAKANGADRVTLTDVRLTIEGPSRTQAAVAPLHRLPAGTTARCAFCGSQQTLTEKGRFHVHKRREEVGGERKRCPGSGMMAAEECIDNGRGLTRPVLKPEELDHDLD